MHGAQVQSTPGITKELALPTTRTWEPTVAAETQADAPPGALKVSHKPQGPSTISARRVRVGVGDVQGAQVQSTPGMTKELTLPTTRTWEPTVAAEIQADAPPGALKVSHAPQGPSTITSRRVRVGEGEVQGAQAQSTPGMTKELVLPTTRT